MVFRWIVVSEFISEELLGRKMVSLRIWKRSWNSLMNRRASMTFCVHLNAKFGGDFTIKGTFDSGKTRAKYVLMPLRDPAHWSRYTRVLAGSNSPIAKVVVENRYRLEDDHHDDVGCDEEADPFTSNQLYMDGQLMQEQLHSHLVGCISNDFDVREFEREEHEQAEENWFGHDDDDDGDDGDDDDDYDDDDDDDRAAHATSDVSLSVLHAMPTQGRLVHDLPDGGAPYFDSWGRISEAQHYVALPPYTEVELMQLSQGGVPLSGGPNYRDVSMVHMAVCDTGLQMCAESLYNHEHVIFQKGMIFNTMSDMKLFLQDYAVYHHRPYLVTHSDKNLRYHITCKAGFPC
jgi:hypothetical protein